MRQRPVPRARHAVARRICAALGLGGRPLDAEAGAAAARAATVGRRGHTRTPLQEARAGAWPVEGVGPGAARVGCARGWHMAGDGRLGKGTGRPGAAGGWSADGRRRAERGMGLAAGEGRRRMATGTLLNNESAKKKGLCNLFLKLYVHFSI
jgi:hypothetical protein